MKGGGYFVFGYVLCVCPSCDAKDEARFQVHSRNGETKLHETLPDGWHTVYTGSSNRAGPYCPKCYPSDPYGMGSAAHGIKCQCQDRMCACGHELTRHREGDKVCCVGACECKEWTRP